MTRLLLVLAFACTLHAQGMLKAINNETHASASNPITFTGNKGGHEQEALNASSITFTIPDVTAGNLIKVGFFACENAVCNADYTGGFSVTDDAMTSYREDVSALSPDLVAIFSGHAAGSGTITVTVHFTGTDGYYASAVGAEFANVKSTNWWDQTGTNTGSSTTPSVTTAGATSTAGELIYSVCLGQATLSSGMGYTRINTLTAGVGDEYKIGSAPGSETAPWTSGSGAWICAITTDLPTP